MPLIKRIESNMFVFEDACDYLANPCNLKGVSGVGLSLEFKKRVPEFIEYYQAACKSGELRMGTVLPFEDTKQKWGLILTPTKDHWQDTSNESDIKRTLEALRNLLVTDQYRYASIGMPMLGAGLGKQTYEVVYPLMVDYLDNLDATVFLSLAPDKTDMRPRYLMIAGPMDFGSKPEEQAVIDQTIDKVMTSWNVKLEDYEGIVSGGYPGVDRYIAGEYFNKDIENTYVFRKTGKKPLVVKPNQVRNGVGANMHQSNTLCEIGDDIILFKPPGHNNNRLSAMQVWVQNDRAKREQDGHAQRRLAVFGDRGTNIVSKDTMIQV